MNPEIAFRGMTQVVSASVLLPQASRADTRISSNVGVEADNFARRVYCVLGMPIDSISLEVALQRIETAAQQGEPLLVSTPNLNFLVNSLSDPEFKASVLDSDLCPPDGTPIIWIARLLGLPINERVAGADLLDQLSFASSQKRPIRAFLFGGANGVASAAAERLNRRSGGLTCVGTMNPGFGSISDMSQDHVIDAINSSDADFLIVSLGAKKGQLWLRRNHKRLKIPVRSHLGAAINFQAGTVKRAPLAMRAWGLEWLWRIKEERYLWTRYRDDGLVFLRLLLTHVVPLAMISRWQRLRVSSLPQELAIGKKIIGNSMVISLAGMATENHIAKAISCFRDALAEKKDIVVDMSATSLIDARFLGLLLMMRKELGKNGSELRFSAVPRAVERIFRLSHADFLLSGNR